MHVVSAGWSPSIPVSPRCSGRRRACICACAFPSPWHLHACNKRSSPFCVLLLFRLLGKTPAACMDKFWTGAHHCFFQNQDGKTASTQKIRSNSCAQQPGLEAVVARAQCALHCTGATAAGLQNVQEYGAKHSREAQAKELHSRQYAEKTSEKAVHSRQKHYHSANSIQKVQEQDSIAQTAAARRV